MGTKSPHNKSLACRIACSVVLMGGALGAQTAFADCAAIFTAIDNAGGPADTDLYTTLAQQMTDGYNTGKGLPLGQWGTIVDEHGIVCAVVHTQTALGSQWLGSRVISAQKASTALDYSTTSNTPTLGLALSTANLWAATQPGGSLFGLQFSNPVDPTVAYGDNGTCGAPSCDTTVDPLYGTSTDPMVGHYIGGNNVFGGGLALYDEHGNLVGALGTSGNTSCADHYISWVVRSRLKLDHVPNGVAPGNTDNIIFDVTGSHNNFESKSGFGQPLCGLDKDEKNYPSELLNNYPVEAIVPPT